MPEALEDVTIAQWLITYLEVTLGVIISTLGLDVDLDSVVFAVTEETEGLLHFASLFGGFTINHDDLLDAHPDPTLVAEHITAGNEFEDLIDYGVNFVRMSFSAVCENVGTYLKKENIPLEIVHQGTEEC